MNPVEITDVCIEIDDLLDGFAVGALESNEMLRVAQALENCPQQAARLAELDDTVGLLGLATETIQPPTDLWDRIAASTVSQSADPPVDLEAERSSRMLSVPRWAAALVSAAAILLLVSSIALGMALRNADDDNNGDFESAMTTYMTSGGTLLALNSQAAPEYMTWPGKGTLLTAPEMPPLVFVDDCKPTDDSGVEYYVWLQKGDVRTPVGTMTIDEDGQGMLSLEGISSITDYDAIGISIKTREDKVYDLMEGWPSDEG